MMTRLFSTTALVLAMGAMPTWADLTVDQAWDVWKAQFNAYGLALEASETHKGDTLTIGEVRLSAPFPMGLGNAYVTFAGPSFSPMGDGRVTADFPPVSLVTLGGEIADEGSIAVAFELETGDGSYIMSGTPENAVGATMASGMTLTLQDVAVSGQQALDVSGSIRFGPMKVRNTTRIDDQFVSINTQSEFEKYDLSYALTLPGDGNDSVRVTATGDATMAGSEQSVVLPKSGIDLLALHEQLRQGLSMRVKTATASSNSVQTTYLNDQKVADQSTAAKNVNLTVNLDHRGLEYGGTAGTFSADVLAQEFPFPISVSGSGVDARLLIPLLMGEGQDAAFRMGLHDLTLNDGIWDLFDPEQKMPRDPMTVVLDMGSKVSLLFEFLDLRALIGGAQPPAMPVMAKTATLNELHLSAAGAEVTGKGDLTFDYNDWTTFDGIPAPEGQASFTVTGAHGLIDRLIDLGLLEQSDATGTRMMLGMFTKPGEGNDVLTTEVEIKKTGEVLANGQRLQ